MKKILVLVAAVAIGFTSCYKEQKPAQAYDVLTRHQWKIFSHVYADVDTGADCRVPSEVEFNKDSTGYFYYYTLCDSTNLHKRIFRWVISYDNRNLQISNIDGVAGSFIAVDLANYNDKFLDLHTEQFDGHFWDGTFVPFADKK
jgi:hypothetical protein